ncbi:MAG: S41 family peptidase [Candidatus Shapirobacteria bacterium]|jgi:hypothetical protein
MPKKLGVVLAVMVVFVMGGVLGYFYNQRIVSKSESLGVSKPESDKYVLFVDEVFAVIKENYWNVLTEEQLAKVFALATEKITSQPVGGKIESRAAVTKVTQEVLKNYDTEDKKKQFCGTLADMVLSNLEPFGRSRLYTIKEEKALSDNVNNKNPAVDRYEELGVGKEASEAAIAEAFKKKPEAQKAYEVLSDPEAKKVYDVSGAEPTIEYKLLSPKVFYMHITKFSPLTFDELKRVTEKADKTEANSLIVDLRDNVGGAIDGLPNFLGPFIGNDQYAYQFFHQGVKDDYKTKTGWLPGLVRFKKVVVLINKGTQSTAELMAATLKKYNVGVLMGESSKGWGTVERVIPLTQQISDEEKFSVFLVHSLTLRDDGQPIEGRGVEPVISMADTMWKEKLMQYFNFGELTDAVEEVWGK